jgi:hypothetical protein
MISGKVDFDLMQQRIYQDAIYFGPTVRFIEIDLENLGHKELFKTQLEIFVSDSIYRTILTGNQEAIELARSHYGDIEDRLNGQKAFYGIGGCASLDQAGRYAFGLQGIYIGINTIENDKDRIKMDANRLYPKHNSAEEREILHMYLDEKENLLQRPQNSIIKNFLPYVAWVIDSKEFNKELLNPKPINLLTGEKIDIAEWDRREQKKAIEQRNKFFKKREIFLLGLFSPDQNQDKNESNKIDYLSFREMMY